MFHQTVTDLFFLLLGLAIGNEFGTWAMKRRYHWERLQFSATKRDAIRLIRVVEKMINASTTEKEARKLNAEFKSFTFTKDKKESNHES